MTERKGRLMSDFLSNAELDELGISHRGGCFVSRHAVIVNPKKLILHKEVRIDALSVLSCGSGGIEIGSYSHISTHVLMVGSVDGIEIGINGAVASGAKIYAVSDDLSGKGLIGPMVSAGKRHLYRGRILLGDYSCVGMNSGVLPGGSLGEGALLMACSVLRLPTERDSIYSGIPAKLSGFRKDSWKQHRLRS